MDRDAEKTDTSGAGNTLSADSTAEAALARPSAIERQRAASIQAELDALRTATSPLHNRFGARNSDAARTRLFVGGSALLLLIGMCAAVIFKELGSIRNPLQAAGRAVVHEVQRFKLSDQPQNAIATKETAPAVKAVTPAPTELSIPLENISLHDRPELFEQLVAVYRSQLVTDPGNTAAQDALNRLRQKGLAELEAVLADANAPATVNSFETVSRLFPELAGMPRYRTIAAQVEQIQRDMERQQPEPIPSIPAAPVTDSSTSVPAVTPSTRPSTTPPSITLPAITDSSAESEKATASISPAPAETVTRKTEKSPAIATALKPEIKVLSATPGEKQAGRYIPAEGGNVFVLVIDYRNFSSNRENNSNAELAIRLGNTRSREVLAEVSTEIQGDSGTTIVPIETFMHGYSGEMYKLNFILNDKFLVSRTIRLSAP